MLFNLYEADSMGAKFHQETIEEVKDRLILKKVALHDRSKKT